MNPIEEVSHRMKAALTTAVYEMDAGISDLAHHRQKFMDLIEAHWQAEHDMIRNALEIKENLKMGIIIVAALIFLAVVLFESL